MTQAAKAQEPSMEEILASIRRIIADDDGARTKAPEPKPAEPKLAVVPPVNVVEPAPVQFQAPAPELEPETVDILDLTESMEAHSSGESFHKVEGGTDIVFAAPEPDSDAMAGAMPPTVAEARRQFSRETEADRSLLSDATTTAVDSAFNSLAQTVLVQNAQTLDGLVREMLRPMLKVWLDDNLPGMVERMVRAEIERVSRVR